MRIFISTNEDLTMVHLFDKRLYHGTKSEESPGHWYDPLLSPFSGIGKNRKGFIIMISNLSAYLICSEISVGFW